MLSFKKTMLFLKNYPSTDEKMKNLMQGLSSNLLSKIAGADNIVAKHPELISLMRQGIDTFYFDIDIDNSTFLMAALNFPVFLKRLICFSLKNEQGKEIYPFLIHLNHKNSNGETFLHLLLQKTLFSKNKQQLYLNVLNALFAQYHDKLNPFIQDNNKRNAAELFLENISIPTDLEILVFNLLNRHFCFLNTPLINFISIQKIKIFTLHYNGRKNNNLPHAQWVYDYSSFLASFAENGEQAGDEKEWNARLIDYYKLHDAELKELLQRLNQINLMSKGLPFDINNLALNIRWVSLICFITSRTHFNNLEAPDKIKGLDTNFLHDKNWENKEILVNDLMELEGILKWLHKELDAYPKEKKRMNQLHKRTFNMLIVLLSLSIISIITFSLSLYTVKITGVTDTHQLFHNQTVCYYNNLCENRTSTVLKHDHPIKSYSIQFIELATLISAIASICGFILSLLILGNAYISRNLFLIENVSLFSTKYEEVFQKLIQFLKDNPFYFMNELPKYNLTIQQSLIFIENIIDNCKNIKQIMADQTINAIPPLSNFSLFKACIQKKNPQMFSFEPEEDGKEWLLERH